MKKEKRKESLQLKLMKKKTNLVVAKKKVEQGKKTFNIFATNKHAHNCTEVLNVDAKNNSQVQSTAHSTEDEIISSEQNDTDTALKCDTATPAEIEKISLQQLNTATSPVTDAIISSKVTVTVPNEKNSINNISGNNNNLVDEKIPDKQNVIPSTNSTSTVNSDAITDNFENGKETCKVQPEKSTSKSIPSKNIAKTGKNSSKKKKARKIEKNKLKVTERQLAEALETIKSYRNLVEKKQKELEHWQNLNAQLQTKVYEKLDEYATRDVNPFEQIAKGAANVGYLRESDNMIHCGNNVYISKNDYDNAKNKLYTYHKKNRKGSRYSGFVRYIAEVIFGYETLKKSSVTGRKSGRSKGEAKEKLDPKLMGAVIGIFRHYLAVDMKLDPVEVAQELKATGEHIASKIADMNRKSKKNEAIEGETKETEQTGEGLLFVGLEDANKSDLTDKPDLTENKEKAGESSSSSEDENSDVSGEETSIEDSESEDTDK